MANTDRDRMAKTLEFEVVESSFGSARVRAVAKDEFLNGVDIAHGGFLFAAADFASALAANAGGGTAISSAASINYLAPCPKGETILAVASMPYCDGRSALCDVSIASESSGKVFAIFQSRLIFKK